MSGHLPFSDLKKGWSPERLARSEARKAKLADELVSLEQLREGLGISQEELASVLDVQQPAISKLVRRPDMKISTLRELIAAMGGEMHITASFPDRSVEIGNFTAAA
jgi:predicted XRE-type DNA-binding protein